MFYTAMVNQLNKTAEDDLARVQGFAAILSEVFIKNKSLDLKQYNAQLKAKIKEQGALSPQELVVASLTKSKLYARYIMNRDAFRNGLGDNLLPILKHMEKALARLVVNQAQGLTAAHQKVAVKNNLFTDPAVRAQLNTIRLVVNQAITRVELIGKRRRVMARAWLGLVLGVSLCIAMTLAFAVFGAVAAPLVPAIALGVGVLFVAMSVASFVTENSLHKQMVAPIKEHTGVDLSGPKKVVKETALAKVLSQSVASSGAQSQKTTKSAYQLEELPSEFSAMSAFLRNIPQAVKACEHEAYDTILRDTKGSGGTFKRFV